MDRQQMRQIIMDTAYIRTGGSPEELRCARYLQNKCKELGCDARLEPFEVDFATVQEARLSMDGWEIPCTGYFCCGSGEIEAPLLYMPEENTYLISQCQGKIVLLGGRVRYWVYQDLVDNGALGFITYSGDTNYPDKDVDQRRLRANVSRGKKILGVNVHAKDAVELARRAGQRARIALRQEEYTAQSHNVIMDLPGEQEEFLVLTAHYDTTSLSVGAYDNMSGCVALLAVAEYFAKRTHQYGLRFIWCGSEEQGLLGSIAYCQAHKEELEKAVLNVNIDMIGSVMGAFDARCTAEDRLTHYIQYMADELEFPLKAKSGIYSSDSTSFADIGVPAVSFARNAPTNTASIHDRYDTAAVLSENQMEKDIGFVISFVDRIVNAGRCPVARKIPEKLKGQIDVYMDRKREEENE